MSEPGGVEVASSFLFVPATHLDRVAKASGGSAHQVVVDLEDAVAGPDKAEARRGLADLRPGRDLLVRVNAVNSPWFEDDIEAVTRLPWVRGVVLPKAESARSIRQLAATLSPGVALVGLVETAIGVQRVDEIAAAGVVRLMLGTVDLVTELGTEPHDAVLSYPRSRIVVASAAARIPPPVDGPALDLQDVHVLAQSIRRARAMGFRGKVCIHPNQLALVNAGFATSEKERAWARRVVEAAGDEAGVFTLDNCMVDAPVLERAKRLLGDGGTGSLPVS
jgi:citrate lyase subunit beta/citryl-CoA lyase